MEQEVNWNNESGTGGGEIKTVAAGKKTVARNVWETKVETEQT